MGGGGHRYDRMRRRLHGACMDACAQTDADTDTNDAAVWQVRMDEQWEEGIGSFARAMELMYTGGHTGKLLINVAGERVV